MSVDACAALVERGDPDRFLAVMTAPVAARAELFPIYAFNVEVTRAPWVSREPMIAQMRIQWWHDVLEEIAAGKPPRAHEVVAPLAGVLAQVPAAIAPLKALVEARLLDVEERPFETPEALNGYLDATAAGLMWAAALVLGTPATSEPAVRAAGWAAGVAAYLRAVPELVARSRRPLPDGRPEAVAALARAGLDRLAEARAADIPDFAVPALRTGWRAEATLKRAMADPAAVGEGRLAESEFARRAGLLRRSLMGSW